MKDVKRYCIDGCGSGMCELEDGPYVGSEDYDAALSTLSALSQEVISLKARLAERDELIAHIAKIISKVCDPNQKPSGFGG